MSDRQKEEMDKDLRKGLASYDLEWHTRSGMPYSVSDLSKVAAGSAQTILLLQDDTVEVSICNFMPELKSVQAPFQPLIRWSSSTCSHHVFK